MKDEDPLLYCSDCGEPVRLSDTCGGEGEYVCCKCYHQRGKGATANLSIAPNVRDEVYGMMYENFYALVNTFDQYGTPDYHAHRALLLHEQRRIERLRAEARVDMKTEREALKA